MHATLSEVNVFVVGKDLPGSGRYGVGLGERVAVYFSILKNGLEAFGFKLDGFAHGMVDVSLQSVGDAESGLGVQIVGIKFGAPGGQSGKRGHGRRNAEEHRRVENVTVESEPVDAKKVVAQVCKGRAAPQYVTEVAVDLAAVLAGVNVVESERGGVRPIPRRPLLDDPEDAETVVWKPLLT